MTQSVAPVSRRRWLGGVVAASAALGVVGLAWRGLQIQSAEFSAAETLLWQQQFVQIDGTLVSMTTFKGKPLVLNFWATWCPPCIEELPLLSAFYSENKANGWQVLGLAVDQAQPVKNFLAKKAPTFPVALAGSSGIELTRSLGNLSGALPFSVVFSSTGLVVHRKIGRVSSDDLQAWQRLVV
jgi:thiol-disulfide isomerase/thioredoxin